MADESGRVWMKQVIDQSTLQQRVELWRWLLPISLSLVVILYQLVLARWVHDTFSDATHFAVEVLFFATVGPLVAFFSMTQIKKWVRDKEYAEAQARIHERWLASITAVSADAILSLDLQGRIESWNHGGELLFGYTANEMHGQPLSIIFGGSEATEIETRWLYDAVQQAGFIRGHETTGYRADGRPVIVDLTATQITDDQGTPLGMSLILRDSTNRKRREEEIRRLNTHLNQQVAARTRELAQKVAELAQANAELQQLDQTRTEFMSLVSHQIRAPLTNMRGAVERLQMSCGVHNPGCSHMFTIIDQQVSRLDRLVQDVLDANHLEAGELALHPEPISVLPAVRRVVAQIRVRLSDRPIHLRETPGLPLAYADRDRLMEVLANLLDNADKYAPADTAVFIEIRADEVEVVISVRDGGPGLPPDKLERIFDKFYRVDGSDAQAAYGYGLGLYVCRQLLEAQNGRIWAENHPAGGALFSIALPVFESKSRLLWPDDQREIEREAGLFAE
jgi:PAS domain S-box-containing protein